MRLFLYRTPELDEDGSPIDVGVVRAANQDMAAKHVARRLEDMGCAKTTFIIYPMKDRLTSGVLKDWGREKPLTFF